MSLTRGGPDLDQIPDQQMLMLCLTTALAIILVLVGGLFAGLTLA